MGILLGLATAVCWGSADLFARFAARRIGAFRTMLYMQACGFCMMTLVMRQLGGWGGVFDGSGWRPWAWGALAGALNTVSTLALYRSFEIGKLSIVAPISASYPVLTMLLSALTGERLTPARLVGLLLTIFGVVLVVRVVPVLGSVPSVWMIRLISTVGTALAMLAFRQSLEAPARSDTPWILGVALLDTSAYVCNNFGMARKQTSVVSVLASLYGAVTVALAAIFLRESVSRLQWIGIAAIFAGIFLISC